MEMQSFAGLAGALQEFDAVRAARFGDQTVLDEVDFVDLARADAEPYQAAAREVLAMYYVRLRDKQRASAAEGFRSALPDVAIMADLGRGVVVRRVTEATSLAVVRRTGGTRRPWGLLSWAHGH